MKQKHLNYNTGAEASLKGSFLPPDEQIILNCKEEPIKQTL